MTAKFLLIILSVATCSFGLPAPEVPSTLHLQNPENGRFYKLNLDKPSGSVLHPGIQVVNVRRHGSETWNPSPDILDEVNKNVYTDPQNQAVVKVTRDAVGNPAFQGVVDGNKLETSDDGTYRLSSKPISLTSDYITVEDWMLEPTVTAVNNETLFPLVAEIAVVCDMEFGQQFNFDRKQILEYWTLYFWDINQRFKSLSTVDISLRITSVTIFETTAEQEFVEQARDENGAVTHHALLGPFGKYMYSQMEHLPQFDIAMAAIKTPYTGVAAGIAYLGTACNVNHGQQMHYGVTTYSEGVTYDDRYIIVHELAHVLGANHDHDTPGCEDRGWIMTEAHLQWFFSSCTDRAIGDFVNLPKAACLRETADAGNLPVDPDFSSTPTMSQQCQRVWGSPSAYVPEEETTDCTRVRCYLNATRYTSMTVLQNTQCFGGGRCFRGRCLLPNYVISNVGTGQCLRTSNGFTHNDQPEMVDCPRLATPLYKFTLNDDTNGQGTFLGTPFIIKGSPNIIENADKCLQTRNSDESLSFDRCNNAAQQESFGWELIAVGQTGENLIKHKRTGRCLAQVDNKVKTLTNCDSSKKAMLWKIRGM